MRSLLGISLTVFACAQLVEARATQDVHGTCHDHDREAEAHRRLSDMSVFAHRLSGMVSVGLNAAAFVNETYR